MANFDIKNKLTAPERAFYFWHFQMLQVISKTNKPIVDSVIEYQQELKNRFGISLEISSQENEIQITTNGYTTYFPNTEYNLPLFILFSVMGYHRWMQAKYTTEGVDIDSNDIVIDCGSFGGGFAKYAISRGAKVYAIEPSQSNRSVIRKNISHPNLTVLGIGLGDKNETMQFNESASGPDSSFLKPDAGEILRQHDVEICRIDTLVQSGEIEMPTFIKVEAEGFEDKVLAGLGDLRVKKIAIDGSDEGEKIGNKEQLSKILVSLEYDVETEVNMIYGQWN